MTVANAPEGFYEQWTARLRSGEDEQGKGKLELDGAKCCLGVAVCVLEEHYPQWLQDNGFSTIRIQATEQVVERGEVVGKYLQVYDQRNADRETSTLPTRLGELLGLGRSTSIGAHTELGLGQQDLWHANDDHERTFPEIADAIDIALAGEAPRARGILNGDDA